jgi:hypothetical protein
LEKVLLQRASERILFPVISINELCQLAAPLGLKKKNELLDFPKRLASEACLTFKGIPFLQGFVILDLSWFAAQFEKLFSHNRGYRFGYIVDYTTLESIFPHYHYEVISFLLKVAEYFSQIYEIIDDSALRYCRYGFSFFLFYLFLLLLFFYFFFFFNPSRASTFSFNLT